MQKTITTLLLLLLAVALPLQAQTTDDDQALRRRLDDAIMQVYNDEIAANPKDYSLYNARANQRFLSADYLRALDDVNTALRLTPNSDKESLFEAYMLRAKIYAARADNQARLDDLYQANRLFPRSINCLGLLAQANYDLGHYDDAENCYHRIANIQPNNYEALAGLARVEVQRKNFGKASEYADKAQRLYPTEAKVYINRAQVLSLMGQHQAAAQDLISAMSVGDKSGEAIDELTAMARTQYQPVMDALNNSIEKAPRVGMFYYVAAQIALSHHRYAQAAALLQDIINKDLYRYHGIYADLALCQYHNCHYDEALKNIDIAIKNCDTDPKYPTTRSLILQAMKRYDEAVSATRLALMTNADYVPALYTQALALIAAGKDKEANNTLNLAIITDPSQANSILLRAWLNDTRLGDKARARADYTSLLLLDDNGYASLRGFALLQLGRQSEANDWADKTAATAQPEALYYAACLYAANGNTAQAESLLQQAITAGYGSKHNITAGTAPCITLNGAITQERIGQIISQNSKAFSANK